VRDGKQYGVTSGRVLTAGSAIGWN